MVDAAIDVGTGARPPLQDLQYTAFADPSGGAGDSFTAAISHCDTDIAVLDALYERRPPFNPSAVVAEIADLCRQYRCGAITGDRYAASWVTEAFAKEGLTYCHAQRDRSAIYGDALPLFTSGRVRLLDNPRLVNQLTGLERRTSPAGRDRIDHGPGPHRHDDLANAVCGALVAAARPQQSALIACPIIVETPRGFPEFASDGGAAANYAAYLASRGRGLLLMNKEQAQQRAAEIKANNAAARHAVEQAKAAEILPVTDQTVDAAVVEANAAVKAARETLDHLRGRKLISEAKGADLGAERTQISFRGHGSGDPAALSRLSVIHREISEHGSEMASIEAAIAEAENRLAVHEAASARALEHQRARETLGKVDDLTCLAADCDTALRNFLLAYDRFEKLAVAIGAVAGRPDRPIIRVLSQKALHTALFGHKDVFDTRHLAPAERLSFADAAAGWGRAARF